MNIRALLVFGAFFTAIIVVAGCAVATSAPPPPPIIKPCKSNSDCQKRYKCVRRACRKPIGINAEMHIPGKDLDQCKSTTDCARGKKCVKGDCVAPPMAPPSPPKPGCTSNFDCRQPYVCHRNRCVPEPVPEKKKEVHIVRRCKSSADCGANQQCLDGKCSAPCNPPNCAVGYQCRDGRCVPRDVSITDDQFGPSTGKPDADKSGPVKGKQLESDSKETLEEELVKDRDSKTAGGSKNLEGKVGKAQTTAVGRYPSMECPQRVKVGQAFPLMFSLSVNKPGAGSAPTNTQGSDKVEVSEDGRVTVNLPTQPKDKPWTIDVVLHAPGFDLTRGEWSRQISLPKNGDSTPALFQLKALSGKAPRTLTVTLWHEGQYLARLRKDIRVADTPQVTGRGSTPSVAMGMKVKTARNVARMGPVELTFRPAVADLTVRIDYDDPAVLGSGRLIISSPHLKEHLIVDTINTSPHLPQFLSAYYAKFLAAARSRGAAPIVESGSPVPIQLQMKGFGLKLYQEFAPQKLKEAMSTLIARGEKFQTIQFYSNNPIIPWELMYLRGPTGKDVGYLGTAFAVARWHISQGNKQMDRPLHSLKLKKLVAVAPTYPGNRQLPSQKAELAALARVPGFTKLDGKFATFQQLMGALPEGIVHFAGHGHVKTGTGTPEFSISLQDSELDLMTWRATVTQQSRTTPLFFFNACDVGQSKQVAGFVEGWAPAILETGASGYVGGIWPLVDKAAAEFAGEFYAQVNSRMRSKKRVRVASLLADIRREFLKNGDPTFMAYVFYGDVNLNLESAK